MVTHIFNPQHDLALADGMPWYKAPQSALQFASDCAILPVWYACSGDAVIAEMSDRAWWNGMCENFPRLKEIRVISSIDSATPSTLEPWGHDNEVYYKLGTEPGCDIKKIMELSDRKITCEAFEWLATHTSLRLPKPPTMLECPESVGEFLREHKNWVVKMPLSGSGKGVIKGSGDIDSGMKNRISAEIKRHGHVMGEVLHDKVVDFAMEFCISDGKTEFTGYSWFLTSEKGIYAGNRLASNEKIEHDLTQFVDIKTLNIVRKGLMEFISERFAGYSGVVGVDMMVIEEGGGYIIDPAVEFNVRHTMGMVARSFYDNFVKEGCEGVMRIIHGECPTLTEAEFHNGRLCGGMLPLCPVNAKSRNIIVADMLL